MRRRGQESFPSQRLLLHVDIVPIAQSVADRGRQFKVDDHRPEHGPDGIDPVGGVLLGAAGTEIARMG